MLAQLHCFKKTLLALMCLSAAAPCAHAQAFTTLHSFDGTDGAGPYAGLIQATDGNLYGTTYQGGVSGAGTVFQITTGGTLAIPSSFSGPDGHYPYARLTHATDGSLYGTTYLGGVAAVGGSGTVFRITTSGAFTTLHSFNGTDGAGPYAGLMQASDGILYGATTSGGAIG